MALVCNSEYDCTSFQISFGSSPELNQTLLDHPNEALAMLSSWEIINSINWKVEADLGIRQFCSDESL